jgi:hypothetical protein
MPKQKRNRSAGDKNLALISVILGASSFIYSFFTGVPAIILGVIALKRNGGNRTQAKLGIIFGTIGSLLIIPVALLAVHFLRPVISQQTSVPKQDYNNITDISLGLKSYKDRHGSFPFCQESDSQAACTDWQTFLTEYPQTVPYPVEFESSGEDVQDRPAGTLVYAAEAQCLISTPVSPNTLKSDDEKLSQQELKNYSALVFYHSGGRACYPVSQ